MYELLILIFLKTALENKAMCADERNIISKLENGGALSTDPSYIKKSRGMRGEIGCEVPTVVLNY
jgi:hypothetical protein